MTPLEKALIHKNTVTCRKCTERIIINNINYCKKSGKILMARFLDCENMNCKKDKERESK